ncbi:unnamed protein product [Symbiodinium natans]|uniref:Uncharacterized protein n=1 Tax=Symbiodinium natans TaxID=878477 RepID=A0A812I3L3_9DINO|nr:unnamed protein product [Symbiodinium natans]
MPEFPWPVQMSDRGAELEHPHGAKSPKSWILLVGTGGAQCTPEDWELQDHLRRQFVLKSYSEVQRLLETLPQVALRELLVKFARPSETEMRSLLEASGWDLTHAQPAIDSVLKRRITLVKQVDGGELTRNALSLCDWEPSRAAALLALQLQLGADKSYLPQLQEALDRSGGDADRAEAVMKLMQAVGSLEGAAKILEQTGSWSVPVAKRVLEIRKRFPRVSVPVAREVLVRNAASAG